MSAVAARLGGHCGIRSNDMAVASLLIEYSILRVLKASIVLHFERKNFTLNPLFRDSRDM
jgi:hypothetical protein